MPKEKKPDAPEKEILTPPAGAAPDAGTPTAPPTPDTGTPPAGAASDGGPSAGAAFTLNRALLVKKPLMKGDDVKAVQEALIALRFGCGTEGANGVYNAATALAVRHFQSMNRLIVNGRVDKFTAAAFGATWEEEPPRKE